MFSKFIKPLSQSLFENEFQLLQTEGTGQQEENPRIAAFVKPVPPVLYLVVVADTAALSLPDFEKATAFYTQAAHTWQEQVSCTSTILLRIGAFDDYTQHADAYAATATGFVPGVRFYQVTWFVDFLSGSLIIPQGESSKVLDIQKQIKAALKAYPTAEGNESLQEIARIDKRIPCKHKHAALTYSIMLFNIGLYALLFLYAYASGFDALIAFGAVYAPRVWQEGEFYRLFSALFVHGSALHLSSNCFGLFIFGTRVEKYMGRASFLAVYIFSGLIANFVGLFVHPNAVSFGASGSVFALVGALTAYSFYRKRSVGGISFIAYATIAISLLLPGFLFLDVDNAAHLVGMLCGFFIMLLICLYQGSGIKKDAKEIENQIENQIDEE